MLKIYATTLSANGRKVLSVSRHLGLEPEIHDVNVYRGEGRTPQYLAINPSGKIPTLIDGEFVLSESNAICCISPRRMGQTDCGQATQSSAAELPNGSFGSRRIGSRL